MMEKGIDPRLRPTTSEKREKRNRKDITDNLVKRALATLKKDEKQALIEISRKQDQDRFGTLIETAITNRNKFEGERRAFSPQPYDSKLLEESPIGYLASRIVDHSDRKQLDRYSELPEKEGGVNKHARLLTQIQNSIGTAIERRAQAPEPK